MATSYKKVLQGNESLITDENTASWTSKLIHCVGLDYISEVFLGTKVLEDFKLLKDCKPASVSNWSFDDNCHFCCLRREKVKDHVVALNRQIVESGGKPLLGKDPSNICRLEWQSEEFLNAVLHRKEYKPRIPDPHIPVVACEIVQQMINHIATFYTSNTNCFWDSLQNNEEKDKSFVKTGGFMYAAAPQNLASNKLIMADQDAPLDLSVKKIKEEHVEQDCVLDLSTKKNFDKGHASHLIKRVSIDQTSTHVRDLQSASTLEEFMSKLCLHHQHQIVDALGFLQAEVKSVASSRHSHAPTLTLSDKQATTSCSRLSFEARSEIRRSKRTCFADVRTHDPSVVRTNKKENRQTLDNDVSNVVPEKPVDLGKMGAEGLLSPHRAGIECGKGSRTSKSCFSKKRKSAHLEKKQFLELKSFQQPGTVSVNKSCCTADPTCLPSYTAESDISSMEKRVANKDAVFKPTTVQKTFDVVVPISPRTARKSRQRSFVRQRNRSSNYIINDPDRHCDLVYVRKSIIECQPQSHNRRHPRQNARKSTRGHRYVEEYLELKTVRTLARKCVSEVSGNCPACLQNVQNTITPKQSLTKPDSVPLIETPSPGVCMKDAVVQNLSSEQMTDIEIPGDEAKATSQGLIVETSQTGKTECNDQFDDELASKQSDVSTEPYVMMEPVSCASHAEMHDSHIGKDRIEVKETSESMELILRKDECDSQTINLSKEKYGFENKSIQQLESSGSHKRAKDDFTAVFSEEPRNDISKINVVPIQVDSVEIMTNNVVDKSAQEQDSQDVEKDHGMVTCVKVSERNQRKLGVSGLKEPERSSEKVDLTVQTQDLVITKHIAPSDRCLRSRGLTANVNIKRECDAELIDLKMKDPNDALLIKQPTNPMEINVPSEAECDFKVSENLETGSKQSLADHHTHKNVDKDESPFLGLQNNSEDFPKETISITPTAKKGRSQEMDNPNTRKMSLRNRSQNLEMELSVDKDNTSPMKRSPPSLKSMFLRSRSKCEPPVSSESSSLIPAGNSEKQDLLSSRRSSCVSEQTKKHLHDLSSSSVMPSRSKSSSATKLTRCSPGKSPIKLTNSSSLICEQPTNPPASAPSIKLESSGYMPLRSSIAEQLAYNKSAVEDASVSPGRMSLRQGNLSVSEKPCGSATSFKRSNRHPQRQQRALMSSGVERSPLASKIKTEKNTKDCFSLSDELLCIAGHQRTEPVVCGPPQFLEVLRGEEHQQLILNLNTKFEKMHKGWVQMDKETQPAPKPKNKADRLKEIWKSKRRTRKSRPVEQQKFSPVQMLFMKPYDLPSICRWFLQSTETKSLVIVKKVNTRLPSETQLCFHTSSTSTGSSNGIFPSLQAERLKKHLKKFAIASPVKNNPKNQRLISKALGQDISVFRSKPEPKTATRISTKAQSLAGLTPLKAPQNHCPVTGSSKNPASARIIKKYSNIREKLQVQQSKKHEEKTFRVTRLKTEIITSKAAKPKLITHNNSKSAIVQNIKSMTKKAKKPAVTKRTLKKNLHRTYGTSPKRLQDLTENASTNALIKKENIKTCEKPYQTKASGIKVDTQRSVLNKCSNSSESLSQYIDTKPLSLEDQVLTRSQRKLECKPSHIRHPKCSTKRGVEQLVTPNKRKRTSKP